MDNNRKASGFIPIVGWLSRPINFLSVGTYLRFARREKTQAIG
jgi:hypothetical protein